MGCKQKCYLMLAESAPKGRTIPFFLSFFLFLAGGNADVTAGVPAAVLDHEVKRNLHAELERAWTLLYESPD